MFWKKKTNLPSISMNEIWSSLAYDNSQRKSQVIENLLVWLKAKGLYQNAIKDIPHLKEFDNKLIINKNRKTLCQSILNPLKK